MSEITNPLRPAPPHHSLTADKLYRQCDPSELSFATTDELEALADHFGQDRAVQALEFGLQMPHQGYNVFLLGSTGIGKRELLENILDTNTVAPIGDVSDWCYVNNFAEPEKPVAMRLPRGMACKLRGDMERTVEELLGILPATFQSNEYRSRVEELSEQYQSKEREAFQELAGKCTEQGIALIQTPNGYTLAPVSDGEVINPEEFEALPEEQKSRTLRIVDELKKELKAIVRQLPGWKQESRRMFKELNSEFSELSVAPIFVDLKKRYKDIPEILAYLDVVRADVMNEAESFTQVQGESAIPDNIKQLVAQFPQYSVNVLVDNQSLLAAPAIYEDNPSVANLIGRVEQVSQMGALVSNFTLIKAGALHRANGGYLILEADKLLSNPFAWQTLKRALRARELRIQSLDQIFSFVSTVQLEPEPMTLDVKVVLTGDRFAYYVLEQYDPEFSTLFKVPADMAEEVPRSSDNSMLFAQMIKTLQTRSNLLPLDRSGVARVIEYAARRIEDSERLCLHRGRLSNLLVESDYCARRANDPLIKAEHIREALGAATHRLDQLREKSHESILRDIMLVATQGSAVGQVNGLAIYSLGDYSFGKPIRITATARLGAGKVLDIEREVDLGGKIHSKAVMIIGALLENRYARDKTLSISASLVFEQSYGGIEGDSASVAELVALISAIADIPVKQSIAVTGSLNQHGEVQAIGGVNEKIEGFFDICKSRGLDGEQAVVIPKANEVHLMLREDVLDAVAGKQFHVYSAATVDDALELLTGFSAASIDASVYSRVDELHELRRKFTIDDTKDNE